MSLSLLSFSINLNCFSLASVWGAKFVAMIYHRFERYFMNTQWGGTNSFSHAEGGGGHGSFGVVLTWVLEVFAMLKWGCNKIPLFKMGVGGVRKVLHMLGWGWMGVGGGGGGALPLCY